MPDRYSHPDDQFLDPKRLQRNQWKKQVQDVPEEHKTDTGHPRWGRDFPEGVYQIPVDSVRHEVVTRIRNWGPDSSISKSVAERGISNPVSVDRGTGEVIDGNHRLNAARHAGMTHVPAVVHAVSSRDPRHEERMDRWYGHLNPTQFRASNPGQ